MAEQLAFKVYLVGFGGVGGHTSLIESTIRDFIDWSYSKILYKAFLGGLFYDSISTGRSSKANSLFIDYGLSSEYIHTTASNGLLAQMPDYKKYFTVSAMNVNRMKGRNAERNTRKSSLYSDAISGDFHYIFSFWTSYFTRQSKKMPSFTEYIRTVLIGRRSISGSNLQAAVPKHGTELVYVPISYLNLLCSYAEALLLTRRKCSRVSERFRGVPCVP